MTVQCLRCGSNDPRRPLRDCLEFPHSFHRPKPVEPVVAPVARENPGVLDPEEAGLRVRFCPTCGRRA